MPVKYRSVTAIYFQKCFLSFTQFSISAIVTSDREIWLRLFGHYLHQSKPISLVDVEFLFEKVDLRSSLEKVKELRDVI